MGALVKAVVWTGASVQLFSLGYDWKSSLIRGHDEPIRR